MSSDYRMTEQLRISDIAWRTRGWNWDYELVLRPSVTNIHWAKLFARVFSSDLPRNTYLFGDTEICGLPFIAVKMCDEVRVDAWQRPIWHFLIRLLEEDNRALPLEMSCGWELCFLKHVEVVINSDEVFSVPTAGSLQHNPVSPVATINAEIERLEQHITCTGEPFFTSECRPVTMTAAEGVGRDAEAKGSGGILKGRAETIWRALVNRGNRIKKMR